MSTSTWNLAEKNECGDPPNVHHAEHDGDTNMKGFPIGHMLEYSL